MTALPQQTGSRFTYADYLGWSDDKRWELIDGVAYDMTPAPGVPHQRAVVELGRQLANSLEGKPCEVFVAPTDICLPGGERAEAEISTVVQPDVFVVCDPMKIEDRGIRGAPDFIIEVASPSTASKDQIVKADLYERHGVREYWVLSLPDRLLTIRVLGAEGRFAAPRFVEARGRVAASALPGLELELDPVFERPAGPDRVRPGREAEGPDRDRPYPGGR